MQGPEAFGFDPYMATARQRHHVPLPEAPEAPATAKERMAAKVRTPEGKALDAKRKVIVEPVFGQIKEDVVPAIPAAGCRKSAANGVWCAWAIIC